MNKARSRSAEIGVLVSSPRQKLIPAVRQANMELNKGRDFRWISSDLAETVNLACEEIESKDVYYKLDDLHDQLLNVGSSTELTTILDQLKEMIISKQI